MVSISSNSTSSTEAWMAVVRSVRVVTWMPAGRLACKLRQQLLDALDDADGVGAGLALHVEDDGRGLVHPRGLLAVFDAVDDVGDVVEHDGRAVAIGDDDVLVVVAGYKLIVGVDLVILARAVEVALGGVDAGGGERGAHVLQVDAVGGELPWD